VQALLRQTDLDKDRECFIEANINNCSKSLLDNPLLPYFVRKHHICINPTAIIKLVLKQVPVAFNYHVKWNQVPNTTRGLL
jgi:hypothetical protein